MPSFTLYFLFLLSVIFSVVIFFKFTQIGTVELLLWSLAILIAGPCLTIGFSNVAIHTIRIRYKLYIDKELVKAS